MKVLVAQSAGFCWGVERAVQKACALAAQTHHTVYTDGPLIHNEQMMDALRKEGVLETDRPEAIGNRTLLIRAHGIAPDRRAALRALPAHLVDATCPDVARIQGLIRKHARRGYDIVIFGDEGHAEVTGLLGHAEGRGHVVGSPDDVHALPELDRVCLVAQSTQLPYAFDKIAQTVKCRFPAAVILDTICDATRRRQNEVVTLADRVDAFVVVGGAHSANTMRLVELASHYRPTLHIQNPEQIEVAWFRGKSCVGLTAGASTPTFIIDAVQSKLEEI